VAEEGEAEAGGHATELPAQGVGDVVQILEGLIGDLSGFGVTPDELDGIEIGGVRRQPLGFEPSLLASEVVLGETSLVTREAIPDQDHSRLWK